MRRFQFPLDAVLRLRRRLEEAAQIALAEQQRHVELEKAEAERAGAALQQHDVFRTALQRHSVSIDILVDADRYRMELARALIRRQERVQAATAAVQTSLEALHRCRIERETLERLRERRLAEHDQAQMRDEQQALDEVSVLRWRRG